MGGAPLRGLGIKTSIGHTSTQLLHPLQTFGSNITGMLGVGILGIANTFCSDAIFSSVLEYQFFGVYTPV
jgi:hypothetical protein